MMDTYMLGAGGMLPCKPDYKQSWVLHSEAQAEIARLEAEIKRKGYEIEMHSQAAEDARQKRDTAWNDAIEAAAMEAKALGDGHDGAEMAEAIRALKRP